MLKGVTETVQNNAKEQKEGFLSMLLDTLAASLLGNILAGQEINSAIAKSVSKETKSKRQVWGINRAGEGIVRAGYGNKNKMDL